MRPGSATSTSSAPIRAPSCSRAEMRSSGWRCRGSCCGAASGCAAISPSAVLGGRRRGRHRPVTSVLRAIADTVLNRSRHGERRLVRPDPCPRSLTAMKIFLDTADIEEIRTVARWGVLDGVTTNPTLYAKVGGSYDEILKEVCKITSGPVSAEVVERRRRRDARGGPPFRDARAEHRGQGRDERERPRGHQPVRRRGHQDQLHADLHGQPGPARGQGRGQPHLAVRRAASTTSTRTA